MATLTRVKDGDPVREAKLRLQHHAHFARHVSEFDLQMVDGRLVVRGRAPSFYLKQLAQSALRGIDGVAQVENRIEVVSPTGLSSVADDHDLPARAFSVDR